MTRLIFGAVVAILLLILYAYASGQAIRTAYCLSAPQKCHCEDPPKCTRPPDFNNKYNKELTEPILFVLTLIGSLVSALVVAVLAITPPSKPIGFALLNNDEPGPQKIVTVVATIYVVVWFICGVALVIAYIKFENAVPAVASGAKSWLGLAVAAAYSYLGLTPTRNGKLRG